MATNTVENPTQRDLGSSDTASLAEQFPATPTDFEPNAFTKSLLDGVVTENPIIGTFSMDYSDAPNILDDIIQNDPSIVGFVPNPTPPGPGDVNPANKGPAPETNFPPPSSGFGSSTSPSQTATKIAEQKFDTLIPGKSHQN